MKAIVYTGHGWSWCDRVKVLLEDNEYEIEEKSISNKVFVEEFHEMHGQPMRTIPQVVIDGELVGGYNEVEARIKGIKSINKVWMKT